MAGRLQRLAGLDTILMSEATRRFVQEEVRVEAYDALDSAELPHSLPVYKRGHHDLWYTAPLRKGGARYGRFTVH